ncbi:MAG: ATP-binding protein [Syntrophobacteraceae bacterium]|jgi:histidine kinase|nr:ATP-binding protein [Syntrophobacteraceae bacterium]
MTSRGARDDRDDVLSTLDLSDENCRFLFNTIPIPVFVLDRRNLKILECNESAEEVYGYRRAELLMTSFLNLFEESEQQNLALELRTSGMLSHISQVTREGRSILVNLRTSRSHYNERPALLVTASDIISILMVKPQLIQASKMATLGEMTAGIAHELNQPLSVIKTASSFLLTRAERGEAVQPGLLRAMIQEIDGHVDRASGMVHHIRDFARKSEIALEPVRVNEVIGSVLDIFSQQLSLRQIEVVRELAPDLPAVQADPNRLEQVLINLLINARDAIEEKQERQTGVEPRERIVVRTSLDRDHVRIEVRDSGIGISEEVKGRIFEPFFTTKRAGKGTGLGLPISYGIVQDFRGHMELESVPDGGASFIVQIPVSGTVHARQDSDRR